MTVDSGDTFVVNIQSQVDIETLTPIVEMVVYGITPLGHRVIVGATESSPNDARETAFDLIQAAEAAEFTAYAALAMRENKVPEETIESVIDRMAVLKERDRNQ